jgi:hypothetical protein
VQLRVLIELLIALVIGLGLVTELRMGIGEGRKRRFVNTEEGNERNLFFRCETQVT